jgi:hypothetical protein
MRTWRHYFYDAVFGDGAAEGFPDGKYHARVSLILYVLSACGLASLVWRHLP